MGLFKRLKNIIRSNINFSNDKTDYYIPEALLSEKPSYSVPQPAPKNTIEQEYYANLELPFGADFEEIKTSYRKLLKKYHPDRFNNDEKKLQLAQVVVKKINLAYNYFENKFSGK